MTATLVARRKCAHRSCRTLLSMYHDEGDTYCWAHSAPRFVAVLDETERQHRGGHVKTLKQYRRVS